MTEHQHRFWNMGSHLSCSCGATMADPRTPEQRERDMERATIAHKIRVNAAMGVDSPNMKRRLAELSN